MLISDTGFAVRSEKVMRMYNVLILCSGNSARSIMAEAILNKEGAGEFKAYSAGSNPRGEVLPETLSLLKQLDYETSSLRSKSWHEFTADEAPEMDFIFTVCDDAHGEVCPTWPGTPISAHWGIEDPSKATGNPAQIAVAFEEAYHCLHHRISLFLALPHDSLDKIALHAHLHEIGATAKGATDRAKSLRPKAAAE